MGERFRKVKGVPRKQALGMDVMMKMFLRSYGLTSRFNARRVFEAWDEVSGAKTVTLNRFYRDGKLFVTMSSSMVRSHLEFQKASLLKAVNDHLAKDSLFDPGPEGVDYVKELIIK